MSLLQRLQSYADKPVRRVIGLMSGTSLDGVDAARLLIAGSGRETVIRIEEFQTLPMPESLRESIASVCAGSGTAQTLSRLNVTLGILFANAAESVAAGLTIDAVASHGQTVWHEPMPPDTATLQLGESSLIAQRLNTLVVSDFRTADAAAGGQGAPLVSYADWCLYTHKTRARALVNIGGIANITYLPPDTLPDQVIGFDCGPGNMLIDRAVQWATNGTRKFDENGEMGLQGELIEDLFTELGNHPFLSVKPPKSTGREEFGEAFWRGLQIRFDAEPERFKPYDVISTFATFTVRGILDALAATHSLRDKRDLDIVLTGGGAKNKAILRDFDAGNDYGTRILPESLGINPDAKEAVAFAILANETLLGNPSNLPSVTGASRPVSLGKITLP